MKRINNLFEQICSIENIELADERARRNKTNRKNVKIHDKHRKEDNEKIRQMLLTGIYVTSKYKTFKIYEPKERIIFSLPYYPDRIIHHAIMNILEPIWINIFIDNTYSCIKGRGIHKLVKDLKGDLQKDRENTKYCLKLDITKFYPSIDHDILKEIIRKKIKDKLLLVLLDSIIDSAEGVPIGNYLSQFFANLYLAYFDHWVKEVLKVKYYYRYADDIVILCSNKKQLHYWFKQINNYLNIKLKLKIKPNYQVFPTDSRGINFVGYVFRHDYILIRKSLKQRMFRLINKYKNNKITFTRFLHGMNSYLGWLKYCNSKHLLQVVKNLTGIYYSNWVGIESIISNFYDRKVFIYNSIRYNKYSKLHFIYRHKSYSVKTNNSILLRKVIINKSFPNLFKIKKYVRRKKNNTKH